MENSNYKSNREKYDDVKASAYSFLIIGTLGIMFFVLNYLNVLPFHIEFSGVSGALYYIVMGGIFVIFFIFSIISLINASKIKDNIEGEETFTDELLNYFTDNYNKEALDEAVLNSSDEDFASLNDADKYYLRAAFLTKTINEKYDNLDEAYVDNIVEQIYSKLYD